MLMDEGITYYCLNWNLKTTYLMYPFLQYHLLMIQRFYILYTLNIGTLL
jgi:hypothetical protein